MNWKTIAQSQKHNHTRWRVKEFWGRRGKWREWFATGGRGCAVGGAPGSISQWVDSLTGKNLFMDMVSPITNYSSRQLLLGGITPRGNIRACKPVTVLFYQGFESSLDSWNLGELARSPWYQPSWYLSVEELGWNPIYKWTFPEVNPIIFDSMVSWESVMMQYLQYSNYLWKGCNQSIDLRGMNEYQLQL